MDNFDKGVDLSLKIINGLWDLGLAVIGFLLPFIAIGMLIMGIIALFVIVTMPKEKEE